jgi:hypothetical protein
MLPMMRARAVRPLLSVDEAVEVDRVWFDKHPDEDAYIREFVPGEFGASELPEIPAGFRYAMHVCVIRRAGLAAVGRYRRLMMVQETLSTA